MIVEGVHYHPFTVRYRLKSGKRGSFNVWSPGYPWIREEVGREMDGRFGIDNIEPGSVTITEKRTQPRRSR